MKPQLELNQESAQARLEALNNATEGELRELFHQVCHSQKWATDMARCAPFDSLKDLKDRGEDCWSRCQEPDWRDALNGHPRIGEKSQKSGLSAAWSKKEQSQAQSEDAELMEQLKEAQEQYFRKFGFIFLICATGKSTEEILHAVETRLQNSPAQEIQKVAQEQGKINQLRLEKLITP